MLQPRFLVLTGVILTITVIRLIPYLLNWCGVPINPDEPGPPWNFSPMTTVCLFGGAYLTSRRSAVVIPLAGLLLSSFGMWILTGNSQYLVYPGMPFVCGCFILTSTLGMMLRQQRLATKLLGGASLALLSEIIFFLVTNAADWALMKSYPHTLAGLWTCYEMGIPFFRHSLLGTALFFPLLFGGLALAEKRLPVLRELEPALAR